MWEFGISKRLLTNHDSEDNIAIFGDNGHSSSSLLVFGLNHDYGRKTSRPRECKPVCMTMAYAQMCFPKLHLDEDFTKVVFFRETLHLFFGVLCFHLEK